jgi:RNA polymerase sigma factor (sigma-70 family)
MKTTTTTTTRETLPADQMAIIIAATALRTCAGDPRINRMREQLQRDIATLRITSNFTPDELRTVGGYTVSHSTIDSAAYMRGMDTISDAYDLVQTAAIALLDNGYDPDNADNDNSIHAAYIAVNSTINAARAKQVTRTKYLYDVVTDADGNVTDAITIARDLTYTLDTTMEDAEYTRDTLNAIAGVLTARQYSIIKMTLQGYTQSAIADAQHCSREAIKNQLAKARERIATNFPDMIRAYKETRTK